MLDFVIFAVVVIICLIVAVIYLYPSSQKVTTVPGPMPVDVLEGNLPDIVACGSLHEFLMDLHTLYGSIASFWWGPQLVISIASPALFKKHASVFDRPAELFELFEPFIGKGSIQYCNGAEGRRRHRCYAKCYTETALDVMYSTINKVTGELIKKLKSLAPDEHIPLREYMFAFAIKTFLLTSFGSFFASDKDILSIRRSYDYCWSMMEDQLRGGGSDADSAKQRTFDKEKEAMRDILKKAMSFRKKHRPEGEFLVIDLVMGDEMAESAKLDDLVTLFVGGFHTTGLLLTWALYFMASHPEVQEKVSLEVGEVLEGEPVTRAGTPHLTYLRQVINETLRCAVLAPFAARYQDVDVELGGHRIPAGTPVVHALGVLHKDPTLYPDPEKFDPERFSDEHRANAPSFSFEPFGFAGKRKCLGYRLSLAEATVLLTEFVKHFRIAMVPGQIVTPIHGIVTAPKEEIWLTVTQRQ